MPILTFVRALLTVKVMLIWAMPVKAQTTTAETLTFDNNQMPSGWGYWYLVRTPGTSVIIQNQRLEIGQIDSSGGITRSFDAAAVSQAKIEYDGNLVNVPPGTVDNGDLVCQHNDNDGRFRWIR